MSKMSQENFVFACYGAFSENLITKLQFKEFSGTRKIIRLIMVSGPKLLELTLYNHTLLV